MPRLPSPVSAVLVLAVLVACFAPVGAAWGQEAGGAEPLAVGSKKFTENVILGWMATHLWEAEGLAARHRAQMGGSRFLYEALRRGDIDAYPEYTGTLVQEILSGTGATTATLDTVLAARGLAATAPLGFNNTYALGMQRAVADSLGIRTISDLRAHPDLTFAFTNEFMERADGWPGLKAAYDLPQTDVEGVDHDLAYRALAGGSVDAVDLFSTDAEIAAYDLRVLTDDRGYFPAYEALYVYRRDLARRAPAALAALRQLEGRIDAATMTRLNKRAALDGVGEARVAARFLRDSLGLAPTAAVEAPSLLARVGRRTREHLTLVGVSLALAIAVALPLGVVAAKTGAWGQAILAAVGVTYTIPALALLAMMVPQLGIGRTPAITALFLYSLLPIVWNTYTGLRDLDTALVESARALGLSDAARLLRVEVPLATRSILAGVKIAVVLNVGTATLGALIAAGGYGQPILTGIRRADFGLILEGTLPAAVLTVLLLAVVEALERALLPRPMRAG